MHAPAPAAQVAPPDGRRDGRGTRGPTCKFGHARIPNPRKGRTGWLCLVCERAARTRGALRSTRTDKEARQLAWTTRTARYGPSGSRQSPAPPPPPAPPKSRKTPACRKGHPWTAENTVMEKHRKGLSRICRICRICRNARRRQRRQEAYGAQAVTPAGVSVHSVAAKRRWAARRQKWGPTGCSPDTREQKREFAKRVLRALWKPQAQRAQCIKLGHPLTPDNVMTARDGSRRCKACWRLRVYGRPEWVTVGKGRVNVAVHDKAALAQRTQLRKALIRAHPDHHGTRPKLEAAQKALDQFLAEEQRWYASIGLPPPWGVAKKAAA